MTQRPQTRSARKKNSTPTKHLVKVVKDFEANEDDSTEISARVGEYVELIEQEKNWCLIRFDGRMGRIPSNCLQLENTNPHPSLNKDGRNAEIQHESEVISTGIEPSRNKMNLYFIIFSLVFAIVGGSYLTISFNDSSYLNSHISPRMWHDIQSCFEQIKANNKPCTVLLIDNNNIYSGLLQTILDAAVLNLTVNPEEIIKLTSKNFMKNFTFFKTVKNKILTSKVVVVEDLENLDGSVVEKLYNFCGDETVIILKVNGDVKKFSGEPSELARKLLNNLWGKKISNKLLSHLVLLLTNCVVVPGYSETPVESTVDIFIKNLDKLENKYEDLNKLWPTVESCYQQTINNKLCSLLLINKNNIDYTDLVNDLSYLAAQILNVDSKNIIRLSSEVANKEKEVLFETYKKKLKDSKIMVVEDLENFEVDAADKFHSICDYHDPAVSGVIIILKLNRGDVEVEPSENEANYAYNLFRELWKEKMSDDLISPLVTRIAENVVLI